MRCSSKPPVIALLLLNQSSPSIQVDLTLSWVHRYLSNRDPIIARCNDIPPGACCQPHPQVLLQGAETLLDYGVSELSVSSLQVNQLGLGYPATGITYDSTGCGGVPIARIFGPMQQPWASFTGPPAGSMAHPSNLVFAARWVNLRVEAPPTPADVRLLALQGVRALVWGPNDWERWEAGGGGSGYLPRRRKRSKAPRLNSFARHGTAYIQPSTRWRYADEYRINGTDYRAAGDGTIRSDGGHVFNVTREA
ncbi:MAG: hypothetical protein Q9208_005285 [Pyrenodesmia sp. 3 TL-2023]